MGTRKQKQCPLLVKYGYPFQLGNSKVADWYKEICIKHCPLQDACVEDYATKIPVVIRKKLEAVVIPCPKCGAVSQWQLIDEDGLLCRYCSNLIYYSQPLGKGKSR